MLDLELENDIPPPMAMDRSMRRTDLDGHLHVESVNLSKANVCPYLGSEIPNAAELGLDPTKVYYLYRDAAELAAAAPTFENKQLLAKHVGVSSTDPQKWLTVGVVSGIHWSAPYLKAKLTVWDGEAIALVESEAQSELSCGYRYYAEMTAGDLNGEHYDGIMRGIVGNHVALVETGRVGPDCFVTDELPQELSEMKVSALLESLKTAGLIAADAKPEALQAAVNSALALDKKAKDEEKEIEKKDEVKAVDSEKEDEPAAKDSEKDETCAKDGKGKDEDLDEETAMDKGDPDAPNSPEGGAKKPGAQDAAIAAAVREALAADRALTAARVDVAPILGEVAMDSAEAVYGAALTKMGVDTAGVHASAFRAMFQIASKKTAAAPALAGDAATVKTMADAIPHYNRLSR